MTRARAYMSQKSVGVGLSSSTTSATKSHSASVPSARKLERYWRRSGHPAKADGSVSPMRLSRRLVRWGLDIEHITDAGRRPPEGSGPKLSFAVLHDNLCQPTVGAALLDLCLGSGLG